MRANLLFLIVVAICLAAFVKARFGLYGYLWFAMMRPDGAAFAQRMNLSTILAAVTLVMAVRHLMNVRHLFRPLPALLILLTFVTALSANSALMPTYSWFEFDRYFRMIVVILTIPILVDDEQACREMFLVMAGSLGLLGLRSAIGATLLGVHITTGPGGFLSDNNTYAIAMAMAVPLCWHARAIVRAKWAKAAFIAMLAGCVTTVVLTFSRGGAIALGVALLLLVFRSRNRATAMVAIVLAVAPVLGMMGAAYQQRLATIESYRNDTSAMSRFVQMRIAFSIWKKNPILGIGVGDVNYLYASKPYLTSEDANVIVHNSFMQVLVHTGIIGFLAYMLLLFGSLRICWKTGWRRIKDEPERAAMPTAVFVSIIAYMVASLAHPRAWIDLIYILMMFASVWGTVARQFAASAPAAIQTPQWALPQRVPIRLRRA